MATDALPVIDVRILSQSDLLSLASSSPNAFDLRQLSDVVPTIDRSVFNESAGSRRQTYSLHPLSPSSSASPHPLPRRRGRPRLHPSPAPPPPPPPSDPSSEDNVRIVSHLRRLFGQIPEPAVNDNALAAVVAAADDRDREIRNAKGEVVDLAALAEKGDLYGEEMRRRTQGLTTAEQILGYMAGLDGEWGSRRRRRKTVDAAVFGDELPRGWKLLLWAKRKEGSVFLDCRRYVSPSGRQFMSCKEVSSYILSLVGNQDIRQPIPEASALLNPSLVPMPPSSGTVVSNIAHDDLGRRENLHISSYPQQLYELGEKFNESHSKKVDEVKERALALVEVGDREVRNVKGEVINLFRLAQKEDLFGEEIKRRTEELRTEEQVLGYMKGLKGQWGSTRKKRKIVDADIFGDELPKGWKVLLGLKRKEGMVYLNCRSYVSPTGKQFMTCKEVSSYILSLVGHEDVRQPISGQHEASALLNPSLVPLQPSSGAAVNSTTCDGISCKENHDISSYPHQFFESRETITRSHSKKVDEVKERASMLVEMGDQELRNGKGEVINLVRLAEKADLFGEEIRRRTEELMTEEQVLGYMKGLEGQWGSSRKKRKIVDANIFADELPKGWKVLLGLKRKEGIVYLNCRRYVSPTGRQFMTCKEVSSYILSVIGNHVARQPFSGQCEASALLNPSLVPLPPSSVAAVNDTMPEGLNKDNLHISSYSNFLESRESKSHSKKVHEVEERAPVSVEMKDREVRNAKGEAINLVRLAEKGDLFREEIRRRTEGLRTEEQLLGYMKGLEGQWGSSRKKRKIVDAGIFGDELPRGWKVLLGLKRKEGIVYLNCRSYFSPSGRQFMSCKEVSSYILSLTGGQDAQPIYCQYDESAPRADKLTSECVPGLIHQDGNNEELSNCALVTPISYNSAECEKHGMLDRVGKQGRAELENMLECRKCKMIFGDKDEQIHHMMTSHGRSAKRRKLGTFLGDVIIKNGTYECQFCHKTFSERHRYSGHIGAHVRYQSLHGGTPFHAITTGTSNSSSCWALVPYVPSETNMAANSKEGTCTAKSVGEVHVDSSHCRSVMENNETEHDPMLDEPEITESVSTTGRVVDNSLKDCDMNGDKFKEFTEANDVTGVNSPSCRDVTFQSVTELKDFTGKVVDNPIGDCDALAEKFKEFTEATDVTGVKSPSCRDGTVPFVVNAKDSARDSSAIVTQETSTSKSVDFLNDHELMTESAVAGESIVQRLDPNVCIDVIAPAVSNMDIVSCETVTETVLPSMTSKTLNNSTSGLVTNDHKSEDIVNTSNGENIGTFNSKSDFVDGQSVDHDMTGYNSGVNTCCMSAEGNECIVQRLDPNVCIDVIAPAVSNMDIVSCETVTETVLPSSTSKTIDNSISGLVTNDHKSEDIVNTSNCENIGTFNSKSDFVDGQSKDHDMTDYNSGVNTCCMSVEGSECYNSLSRSLANVEDTNFSNSGLTNTSSNAAISACQDCNGGHKVEVENHFIAFSGNGSSYGVIDYTNGMFTSSVEEHGEIDSKTNVKGDTGSHMLTSKDTDATGTMHNDLNASYFIHSFSREQTCGIETTTDCMFPGDLNKSIFEEFDDVGNEVHNCFHSSTSACEDVAPGDIISDDDGGLSLQLNVANKSSWLQSSNSLPILDMIPDQGEDGHGDLGPKTARENISGFDELRLGSMGPADFLLLTTQESGSQARSPIEFLPSGQLEWSLSLPNMSSTVASTSVCVWCNREFISEDGAAEQQSGSLGYMCPECKARISGQFGGFS